jgi:hypothetical protein
MCWDQSWLGLQPQSLHFVIICCPGVTHEFLKLCQQGLLECCKETSIFTSTAYEGCQTPCMCLTLMCWDQSWLGLQPQSPHFIIICCPGVTREFPKLCQQGLRECVRTHLYSHPLHMKVVKLLFACVWHWCWSAGINLDWVYSLNHCTSPSFVAQELPRFLGEFPKLGQQEWL